MQRLLPKHEADRLRKEEERQRMEEGLRIAERVDSLREVKISEEVAFEEYRVSSLTAIQSEIEAKKIENEQLATSNKFLKEERIRLEAPLDVAELWDEIHRVEKANDSLAENLLFREINVTKRENDVEDNKNGLVIREKEVERSERSVEQSLRQAEEQRSEAETANKEAQSILTKMQQQQQQQDSYHSAKHTDLKEREEALIIKEEDIEGEWLTINSEKILLADRRATLERGFAELRRKQT